MAGSMRPVARAAMVGILAALPFVPMTAQGQRTPVMASDRVAALLDAATRHLDYLPGEVVVKFRAGVTADARQRALLALRSRPDERALQWSGDIARLRDPSQPDAHVLADQLAAQPEVEFAQPNYVRHVTSAFVPNDPDFRGLQSWNFDAADIPRAWSVEATPGGSSSVIVAVVDTGITAVPAQSMSVQTWNGTAIVAAQIPVAPSPDLDFSRLVKPMDFTVSTPSPFVVDSDSHGTHVASTIGESTNNDLGLAGIAFHVQIMPVKVCSSFWDVQFAMSAAGIIGPAPDDAGGCADTDIANGIRYAADNGARVINISLGGPGADPLLFNALTYAVGKGAFVAIAMGNDFQTGNPVSYPAGFATEIDGVVSVGATGPGNVHAVYSTTGPQCELSAPGGDFTRGGNSALVWQVTLDQNSIDETRTFFPRFDTYAEVGLQGTSMATPHVSATAALAISQIPSLAPANLEHLLESTALDLGQQGRDNTYGFGLVQAGAALRGQGVIK